MERDYDENDTDAVAEFSATDEDGDAIAWSLDGVHKSKFDISDMGVLTFKSPPDFEVQETFEVTVKANAASFDVVVNITNMDEPGKVNLDKPQPQVGRELVASVTDPDSDPEDQAWQWAKSMDGETGWMDIDKATSANRSPDAADEGYYLRATATYTDMFGEGKMESAVTENPVEGKTTSNAAPSFDSHDTNDEVDGVQVTYEVPENSKGSKIGKKPLSASDTDNDLLLYSIVADTDADSSGEIDGDEDATDDTKFDIDPRSGQLKVDADLSFEAPSEVGDTDNAYVITVRATDPSGAPGEATVTITVTDVNEAPKFPATAPTALTVEEEPDELSPDKQLLQPDGDDQGDEPDNLASTAYVVTDDDNTGNPDPPDTFVYDLEGADESKFNINDSGVLIVATDHTPNFEKQPSYSITITATDASTAAGHDAITTKLNVTIKVVDAEDDGSVSFMQREPQVGRSLTARVSDPDGSVTRVTWQWAKAEETDADTCPDAGTDYTGIDEATSPSYTPKAEDADDCLQATASYFDNIVTDSDGTAGDDGDTAMMVVERGVQTANSANSAPKFGDLDPDMEGTQSDAATREVKENTKDGVSLGDAIGASDSNTDRLIYTLGGADADSFGIDRMNGQLMTKAALNYEVKDTYSVTVTASDPSLATATVPVTINVTDENDKAVITGEKEFEYTENDDSSVASFEATDEDGHAIVWSVGGDDKAKFDISDEGVLTFKSPPDFETKPTYSVTIMATGGELKVSVKVTNLDEPG